MSSSKKKKNLKKALEVYGKLNDITIPTDVGIYVISYKRPKGNTMKSLKDAGIDNYTIILGNDDDYYHEYVKLYGKERISVFDKAEYMDRVKYLGNSKGASGAAPARNYIRDLSISRGEDYHITLDDDYSTIEACMIRVHLETFRGKWLFYHSCNIAKRFLERTGLPYISGSLPNSPVGCKMDFTTPSIVRKGFNSFVFNNKKWVNWRFKTADDVMLTLTCWQLGIPVYGCKPLFRMGLLAEAAGKGGNVDIYKSDLSWFKAFSATMAFPNNNKAGLRFIKTLDRTLFAHKLTVSGAVPFVIDPKYGIANKKLDHEHYYNQYKTWRYKG